MEFFFLEGGGFFFFCCFVDCTPPHGCKGSSYELILKQFFTVIKCLNTGVFGWGYRNWDVCELVNNIQHQIHGRVSEENRHRRKVSRLDALRGSGTTNYWGWETVTLC